MRNNTVPCTDVTENLVISLDPSYHVRNYALRKRTCGAKVGNQSLLQDWIQQQNPQEVVEMHMDNFMESFKMSELSEYDRFIAVKHFSTLKNALLILMGEEKGSKHDQLTVDVIEYSAEGIDARMFVGLDINPEDNPGCSTGCSRGGCGS